MSSGEKQKVYSERCERCLFSDRPLCPPDVAARFREAAMRSVGPVGCHRSEARGEHIACAGWWQICSRQNGSLGEPEFVQQPPFVLKLDLAHYTKDGQPGTCEAGPVVLDVLRLETEEDGTRRRLEWRPGEEIVENLWTIDQEERK